jgi:hypothetical protein
VVAHHLKPGGRFVTFQMNPSLAREGHYYEPYGIRALTSTMDRSCLDEIDERLYTGAVRIRWANPEDPKGAYQ